MDAVALLRGDLDMGRGDVCGDVWGDVWGEPLGEVD